MLGLLIVDPDDRRASGNCELRGDEAKAVLVDRYADRLARTLGDSCSAMAPGPRQRRVLPLEGEHPIGVGLARQGKDFLHHGRPLLHRLASDQVEGQGDDSVKLLPDCRGLLRRSWAAPGVGDGAESGEETESVPRILQVAVAVDVPVVRTLRSSIRLTKCSAWRSTAGRLPRVSASSSSTAWT